MIIINALSKTEKNAKKLLKKFTAHSCILEGPVL